MLSALRRTLPGGLFAGAAAGLAAFQLQQQPDGWSMRMLAAQAEAQQPPSALDPKDFKAFKLAKKEKLSHNTSRYIFELPKGTIAGTPVASCFLVRAMLKEKPEDAEPKPIVRPYTPVSSGDATFLEMVIKTYPDGKMSRHFDSLKVGDTLDIKGPLIKFKYEANSKKKIGMVAGGTGITPMWQVASHIINNPEDKTEVTLVFGNVSEEDILIKDLLDGLAKKDPKRFKVYYVVDRTKDAKTWKGGVGHVTADVLKKQLPPPGPDVTIMVCGPPGLMKAVSGDKESPAKQGPLQGLLKELGYTEEQVFKF